MIIIEQSSPVEELSEQPEGGALPTATSAVSLEIKHVQRQNSTKFWLKRRLLK